MPSRQTPCLGTRDTSPDTSHPSSLPRTSHPGLTMPLGFYVRVLDHKWLLFAESTVHTVAALTAQATRDAHSQGFLAPNQSLASLQLCLNGSDFIVLNPASEVSLLVAHCTAEKEAGHDVVLVGQARKQERWGGCRERELHAIGGARGGCLLFPIGRHNLGCFVTTLLPPAAHPAPRSPPQCSALRGVRRSRSGTHSRCLIW